MEYYLIVISIACVKRKIIKLKYPVACSRSVGAAGERDLLWSMTWGRAIQAFRVLGPSSLQGGFSKVLCWRLPIIAATHRDCLQSSGAALPATWVLPSTCLILGRRFAWRTSLALLWCLGAAEAKLLWLTASQELRQ